MGDRSSRGCNPDGESLVVWVDRMAEALAQTEPEKFFWTPHYDKHPMVQVRIAAVDREELGELLRDSWRRRAPGPVLRRAGVG